VFDAMLDLPLDEIEGRVEADRLLGNSIDDADIRKFLLTNLYRDQGAYAWRVNLDALLKNRRQLATAPVHGGVYTGPTLLVKGARSDYISSRCNEAIARQLPQTELKIIADAGHWPHAEKPVVFNALVSRFLQRCYPPKSVA
jgi:esterase